LTPAGLPDQVVSAVEELLGPLESLERVGGGCIHPAGRIRARDGSDAFIKWSSDPGPAGFAVEARGLEALAARGGVPVPEVLGVGEGSDGQPAWLLLEWIAPGSARPHTPRELGVGLAHLHRPLDPDTGPTAAPGWEEDGWIATLPQPNPGGLTWPEFWAQARIEPQWRRARDAGGFPRSEDRAMETLLDRMDEALEGWEADGICLLHGDLWSGNVHIAHDGTPYLVDPAAYRGHREVDLAMLDLFGGFGDPFHQAYREATPLVPGHRRRRSLYQLYPLLVHVNLFGGGYTARALDALNSGLAAI